MMLFERLWWIIDVLLLDDNEVFDKVEKKDETYYWLSRDFKQVWSIKTVVTSPITVGSLVTVR